MSSRFVRLCVQDGRFVSSGQVAPLPWSHIALTGDYLWNEIDQPLERFRPIRANRFNPKSLVFP